MITLVFPLAGVLLLAEHALTATSHAASMREVLHGTTPRPALWLVGDQGVFLMSNGHVTPPDADHVGGLPVVYAGGYRTQAAWLAVADQIGHGNEIRAVLALLDPTPGQGILHRELTAGAAAGAAEFVIELDARHLRWHVPAAGATEANR
jgi:hypothetical protein